MNAAAFRHFYDYHFSENRKIWDTYIAPLSQGQFIQPVGYSHGSVRDQIGHLMQVDEAWFTPLRGADFPEQSEPVVFDDRQILRARWDIVEQQIRAYLATVRDEQLMERPFAEGEDKDLFLWQVLVHVVNHGTDHRAQLLRQLNDIGIETVSQDYIFYVYGHP